MSVSGGKFIELLNKSLFGLGSFWMFFYFCLDYNGGSLIAISAKSDECRSVDIRVGVKYIFYWDCIESTARGLNAFDYPATYPQLPFLIESADIAHPMPESGRGTALLE